MLFSVSDFPYLWAVSVDISLSSKFNGYTFDSHSTCSENLSFNSEQYLGVSYVTLESWREREREINNFCLCDFI